MATTTRRRTMLLGSAGLAALALGAGGAALGALPLLPGDARRRVVQRVIYRHVPGIVFDGEDLARFAAYIEGTQLNRHRMGLRGLAHYGGVVLLHDWPVARILLDRIRPTHETTEEVDRGIVNAFFRATDFWDGPRTPGRRIALVRSPDPWEARCSNPLAVMA